MFTAVTYNKVVFFYIYIYTVTYPGCLGAQYTGLGTQTLAPKKGFLTFYLKIFLNIHGEECFIIQFM